MVAFLNPVVGTKILLYDALYHLQTMYFWGKNYSKCAKNMGIGNLEYDFYISEFINDLGKFAI